MVTKKRARQDNWLAVHRQGLAQVLAQKGKARVLVEIVSNALDTEATTIAVSLIQAGGRADFEVIDDDPDGFANLADSYTLYAPSTRADDASKRGRFGLGDKEVLAICEWASVRSTKGAVEFNADGSRAVTKDTRTSGSQFSANLKMNATEAKEFDALMSQLLIPEGTEVSYNGRRIESRSPLREFKETLGTVLRDAEGNLRPTRRQATVQIYKPMVGEQPHVYELGVPVVEADGRWHVNVLQKVPLNSDRTNVTPAWLRELREHVLNHSYDLLSEADSKSRWVRDAYDGASDTALKTVVEKTYGKKAVLADPSDQEAVARCTAAGYTVIPARNPFPKGFGPRLQAIGLKPAGQVMPTMIVSSPDGQPPIPEKDWTPGMRRVAEYSRQLHLLLFGRKLRVAIFNLPRSDKRWLAKTSGRGDLDFNVGTLGKNWFEQPDQGAVDAILIHEFAHRKSVDNHFTERFYDECCRLGALMRDVPLRLTDIKVN